MVLVVSWVACWVFLNLFCFRSCCWILELFELLALLVIMFHHSSICNLVV